MATIAVGKIEPGMVLADDLKDANGRFLLAKGISLTPKHLKIMKTWGVVEAEIEGITEEEIHKKRTADIDPAVLAAAEHMERNRFVHTDTSHEAIRELFQICVVRRARTLARRTGILDGLKIEPLPDLSSCGMTDPDPELPSDPESLIRKNIKLPSLPTIFHKINEAINDPRCSATHIASIISKDSSLSARLLQLVNSAFYNFPSKIDTVSRAVAIIGTKQLSTLSLGTCALAVFKDVPSDLIDMRSFWEHSIACGIIARILSSYKNNTITERFFVGGVLHDIGRLVQFTCTPDRSRQALMVAGETNNLLYRAEESVMGFDHTRIGGLLMKEWKLPIVLENAARFHHCRQNAQIRFDTAVIHLADLITNALAFGTSGERFVPPLDIKAWEELNLSTSVLEPTIHQAEHHVEETAQIFFKDENA